MHTIQYSRPGFLTSGSPTTFSVLEASLLCAGVEAAERQHHFSARWCWAHQKLVMWCFPFCESLLASEMQLLFQLYFYYQALTATPYHQSPVPPPCRAHLPISAPPSLTFSASLSVHRGAQRSKARPSGWWWWPGGQPAPSFSRFPFLLGLSLFSFCPSFCLASLSSVCPSNGGTMEH